MLLVTPFPSQTIRASHHPSIFTVFIAPFSYTPTYTSAIRRHTLFTTYTQLYATYTPIYAGLYATYTLI